MPVTRPPGPIHILLVEDDPGDVEVIRRALRSSKLDNELHIVNDGEAALDYVRRIGRYAEAPRPDLIVLDLNLPRVDGREVLRELKRDPALETLPVVVLTTSRDDRDVLESYRLQANCYVVKPFTYEDFLEAVHDIEKFWLKVAMLPRLA